MLLPPARRRVHLDGDGGAGDDGARSGRRRRPMVIVAIQVVEGRFVELTAREQAAERLPELVRHRVVEDWVNGAKMEEEEMDVVRNLNSNRFK